MKIEKCVPKLVLILPTIFEIPHLFTTATLHCVAHLYAAVVMGRNQGNQNFDPSLHKKL